MTRRSKQQFLSWVPGTHIGEGNGMNKGVIEPDSNGVGKGLAQRATPNHVLWVQVLIYSSFYKGGNWELGCPTALKRQDRSEDRVGLRPTWATIAVIWGLEAGTGARAWHPRHIIQGPSSTSTWSSPAERLSLLFWKQSYIFNDLQNLPVRREGELKLQPSNLHCE